MAAPTNTLHWVNADVEVHKVVVGPFENNVFVVRCTETGDAVIIDAASEDDRLLDVAEATGVRRVLTTHGHWDHIQAVVPPRRMTPWRPPAPVAVWSGVRLDRALAELRG